MVHPKMWKKEWLNSKTCSNRWIGAIIRTFSQKVKIHFSSSGVYSQFFPSMILKVNTNENIDKEEMENFGRKNFGNYSVLSGDHFFNSKNFFCRQLNKLLLKPIETSGLLSFQFASVNCCSLSCPHEGNVRYLHIPKLTAILHMYEAIIVTKIIMHILWPQIA